MFINSSAERKPIFENDIELEVIVNSVNKIGEIVERASNGTITKLEFLSNIVCTGSSSIAYLNRKSGFSKQPINDIDITCSAEIFRKLYRQVESQNNQNTEFKFTIHKISGNQAIQFNLIIDSNFIPVEIFSPWITYSGSKDQIEFGRVWNYENIYKNSNEFKGIRFMDGMDCLIDKILRFRFKDIPQIKLLKDLLLLNNEKNNFLNHYDLDTQIGRFGFLRKMYQRVIGLKKQRLPFSNI